MNSLIDKAREVILKEAEALKDMADRLDDSFAKAVNLIFKAKGRVIIAGIGKSGQVAKKIAATLSSTGTPAFFIHPTEGVHGDIGMVLGGDVAILISKSGDTEELLRLLPIFKRLDVPVIALTGGNGSPLAQQSDVVLDTSVKCEACPLDLIPTSSATAALVMGDALAVVLVELRGFTVDDFSFIHPGGALGRKLIKIGDLMHTGDELPIVRHDASFKDMLVAMTSRRFGLTLIVNDTGKLIGIFTDGDLRRTVEAHDNPLDLKAGDIAVSNPKKIGADELAATAVAIMEDHNITSLVITDGDGRPEGLIHLHDLLKAKVV
ncbi:MAG: KpsF/GutQ family sugar-phosphate isomerase [candidate division Zixibacteria bacterium]